MGFLDELKRRQQRTTPGFAGGTLEEQLQAAGDIQGTPFIGRQPRGEMPTAPQPEQGGFVRPPQPTMADRAVASAVPVSPNTVAAPPPVIGAERGRAVSFDPVTGKPNEDFYRDKGDIESLYNAETNWKPRGAKRGFKNSLKAGAMMAAEAVRNNPDDPVTAALAGFGIGAAGGTAAPNFKNRLARNWKLNQVGGELKRKLELEKERAQIDQGTMVPVTLDSGETVMVPQRTAGSLRSQQQRIGQQGDVLAERKRVNTDRKNRWDSMDKRDRMRNIISLYNSGGLNDPELLEYAADQLGLPAPMREKFVQGKLRDAIDAEGNLIQVNRATGQATPVTAAPPVEGQAAAPPVKGYQVTQEAGKQARAAAREQRLSQPKPPKPLTADRPTMRKAAELAGQLDRARQALTDFDAAQRTDIPLPTSKQSERQKLVQAATGIASELTGLGAGYEAGIGEKGYPYYKKGAQSDLDQPIVGMPTAKPSGRTIEGAVGAFKNKYKREPTADEIARMRAALGQ